jgi:hypothetical protein
VEGRQAASDDLRLVVVIKVADRADFFNEFLSPLPFFPFLRGGEEALSSACRLVARCLALGLGRRPRGLGACGRVGLCRVGSRSAHL